MGSGSAAPCANVSFTLSLWALATANIPPCDHAGDPIHFHSSTTSGSTSRRCGFRSASRLSNRPSPQSSRRSSWTRSNGLVAWRPPCAVLQPSRTSLALCWALHSTPVWASRSGFRRGYSILKNGGAEGIRTPDPLLAKQVLSQLSYGPTMESDPPQYTVGAHLADLGCKPSCVRRCTA